MSATATTSVDRPSHQPAAERQAPGTFRQRAGAAISSVVAAVLGILPHVLHHVGPLAGAALVAGTGGTLLFGAIGLVAAIPFVLRVHRRCGNWRVPAGLLALFAVVFSISAFVIGPAITGSDSGKGKPTTHSGRAVRAKGRTRCAPLMARAATVARRTRSRSCSALVALLLAAPATGGGGHRQLSAGATR